jgi:phosphatidylglycerophosphate synthase
LSATATTERPTRGTVQTTTAIVVVSSPNPPILERLIGQFNELGVRDVRVVTSELDRIAEVVREAQGGIALVHGDIVTNNEALAGLIADPRIVNGVLVARGERANAPALRTSGTNVVSAGSDVHTVSAPNAAFLGVLKVGAAQRELLAQTAERVAPLGGTDVVALLTVGLVRAGVPLRTASLRGMVWERPGGEAAIAQAANVDEDNVLLDSAVKSVDGFFTTFFVSPYSRHVARWAARRGLTPNQVTAASFLLGILSAACFATGERWGLIAGAVLLQVAFMTDCVDGQLARYTRQFSQFGAWLDATFDRAKEYLVFAGLAIGADRAGAPVWVLAAAALTLQVLRHTMDFSWHGARRALIQPPKQPPVEERSDGAAPAAPQAGALARWRSLDDVPGVAWGKRIIAFPIGERFALISITAAIWSPRTTFIAWLAWGGFATTYGLVGRLVRSTRLRRRSEPDPQRELESFRDDGPIARALAPLGETLSPVALCAAAVVPLTAALAIKGDSASDQLALGVIGWLLIVAGITGGRTGASRIRWLVPPLLRFGEYAGLLWVGTLAGATTEPAAFALLAALTLRHYDIVYGLRYRGAPISTRLGVVMGGWDGRLALAGVLLVTSALPAGFYAAAAIIAVVCVTAAIQDWSRARMPVTFHDDKEDEDA